MFFNMFYPVFFCCPQIFFSNATFFFFVLTTVHFFYFEFLSLTFEVLRCFLGALFCGLEILVFVGFGFFVLLQTKKNKNLNNDFVQNFFQKMFESLKFLQSKVFKLRVIIFRFQF